MASNVYYNFEDWILAGEYREIKTRGAPMFPVLKVGGITGLEPNRTYSVAIEFISVKKMTWSRDDDKSWIETAAISHRFCKLIQRKLRHCQSFAAFNENVNLLRTSTNYVYQFSSNFWKFSLAKCTYVVCTYSAVVVFIQCHVVYNIVYAS